MFKKNLILYACLAFLFSGITSLTYANTDTQPTTNHYWWPNQLDLSPLRHQNPNNNPLGKKFNYAKAFDSLNLNEVKKDLAKLMTTPKPWWSCFW